MRPLRFVADSLISVLQEPPAGGRSVLLEASTARSRSLMREALPEVLADCGCGAPVVTETQDRLNLCFDVPLESVPPFYWQMVGVELEFGPESHRELARLCTVRRHAAEMLALDRPCTVRLELRFRGERRQTTPEPGVARA